MNIKKNIRDHYLKIRNDLDLDFIKCSSNIICSFIIDLFQFKTAEKVLLYSAFNNEVNLSKIHNYLLSQNRQVFYPRIDCLNVMHATELQNSFVKHSFGFFQPGPEEKTISSDCLDVIIIPGLAFDRDKNRLGYGKGFYDKYLINTRALKVGVCYLCQISEKKLPVNSHDISMDLIITEDGVIV